MAVVGVVARTHGRRGEVVVNPETDFPEARFRAGSTLFLMRDGEPQALRVRAARQHGGRPVIALERIGTLGEAEQLRGAELRVPDESLHPLPAGAYYEHDLVGCAVRTARGDAIGTVASIEGPDGAKRLIVKRGRSEIDVPLAADICVSIDPAAGTIVIDPPAGLLDVNRTRSARTGGGRPMPASGCAGTGG
jgi:16S rRNA processing protein RimM